MTLVHALIIEGYKEAFLFAATHCCSIDFQPLTEALLLQKSSTKQCKSYWHLLPKSHVFGSVLNRKGSSQSQVNKNMVVQTCKTKQHTIATNYCTFLTTVTWLPVCVLTKWRPMNLSTSSSRMTGSESSSTKSHSLNDNGTMLKMFAKNGT